MHPYVLSVSRASARNFLGPRAVVTRITLRHSAAGAADPTCRSTQTSVCFATNSFRTTFTLGEPTKTLGRLRGRGSSYASKLALRANAASRETFKAATQIKNMATNDPGIAISESGPLGNTGSTTVISASRTGREWLVIASDRDGALQRRLEVREYVLDLLLSRAFACFFHELFKQLQHCLLLARLRMATKKLAASLVRWS